VKVNQTFVFKRILDEVLDAYPLDADSVYDYLNNLSAKFPAGDRCPGYGMEVRKLRIPLPRYRFSASKGLRLLVLKLEQADSLLPLVVYKKGRFKRENEAIAWTKSKLREILQEVTAKPASDASDD
jgi:hypothetical protein